MKRRYMVFSGCVCMVFAYANVLAGKIVLGYMCGLSALLIGWFLLYMLGTSKLHWMQVLMHVPFIYGCIKVMQMPYEVGTSLGIVGCMSVGYSLMMQMLMNEWTVKECKVLIKWLMVLASFVAIVWMIALSIVIVRFDWILVGNDWMNAWDAICIEVISMSVFVGLSYLQAGCILFQRNELILN